MALAMTRAESPLNENQPEDPGLLGSVPAALGSRLHFSWGLGPHIKLCEGINAEARDGGHDPCSSTVLWSTPSMEQRRIAYDVLPLYQELRQKLHQQEAEPGRHLELRDTLLAYSKDVLRILSSARSDDGQPPQTPDELQVLYEAAMWHFLQIFFLHTGINEGFFAEDYVDWLQQHGSLLSSTPGLAELQLEVQRLQREPRIEQDRAFWPTIVRLVAVGQLDTAGELMLMHPAYKAQEQHQSEVKLIDHVFNLLRRTPRLRRSQDVHNGLVMDDQATFVRERKAWHNDVVNTIPHHHALFADVHNHEPAIVLGLKDLLSVMEGFSPALDKATNNWAEVAAASLMWQHPTLNPFSHMASLVDACKGQKPDSQDSNGEWLAFLEELMVASAGREAQRLVQLATNSEFCGLWFVAHMYDVMRGYPQAEATISRQLPHLGGDQAEQYMLHYVATLMGQATTWQLAAGYLAWCPAHGAHATEALIASLPFALTDARAAHKALEHCERHGLSSTAQGLCRRLGMAAAQQGLLGEALRWLLRAHDQARCAALVAPLVAKVGDALAEHLGSYQAAALQLPELQELEPLLECLPGTSGGYGDGGEAGAEAAARPYPELQFLRSCLRLQHAAGQLAALQQRHQQQHRQQASAAADAALRAAYAAARQPLLELLCGGLAPAQLLVPLLFYAIPWLDSDASPFSQEDVECLLQALQKAAEAQAAGLEDDAGVAPRYVQDVRLALARALARAHVLETSAAAAGGQNGY